MLVANHDLLFTLVTLRTQPIKGLGDVSWSVSDKHHQRIGTRSILSQRDWIALDNNAAFQPFDAGKIVYLNAAEQPPEANRALMSHVSRLSESSLADALFGGQTRSDILNMIISGVVHADNASLFQNIMLDALSQAKIQSVLVTSLWEKCCIALGQEGRALLAEAFVAPVNIIADVGQPVIFTEAGSGHHGTLAQPWAVGDQKLLVDLNEVEFVSGLPIKKQHVVSAHLVSIGAHEKLEISPSLN